MGSLVPSVTGNLCCENEVKMPTLQQYVKGTLSLALNVWTDFSMIMSPSCVLPAVWVLGVREFHLLLHPTLF